MGVREIDLTLIFINLPDALVGSEVDRTFILHANIGDFNLSNFSILAPASKRVWTMKFGCSRVVKGVASEEEHRHALNWHRDLNFLTIVKEVRGVEELQCLVSEIVNLHITLLTTISEGVTGQVIVLTTSAIKELWISVINPLTATRQVDRRERNTRSRVGHDHRSDHAV